MTIASKPYSDARGSIGDTPSLLHRMDDPALGAARRSLARPALSKGLLGSLLCSVALLTGSGAAFADQCLPPYTVGVGETCSNVVIGDVNNSIFTAPPTAVIENSGAINFDPSILAGGGRNVGAITHYGSVNSSLVVDPSEIHNYNIIESTTTTAIYNDSGGNFSIISNSDTGKISGGVSAITNVGKITSIENTGLITANGDAVLNTNGVITKQLLNNVGARITGGTSGINNSNEINTIDNRGTISSTQSSAIKNDAGIIDDIENSGFITGSTLSGSSGIVNDNGGSITNLTNSNAITGSAFGISNTGAINTFTNYQGGGGSAAPAQTALTYAGQLPGSYFIHITSASYYGQVAFTNPTGSMTFGVTQGSNIEKRTYYSVLSYLDPNLIAGSRSGVLKGLTWYLELHPGATDVWDLVFKDPTTPTPPTDPTITTPTPPTDPSPPTQPVTSPAKATPSITSTLVALGANAASLRQALNARTAAMVGAMDYDCASFDAEGYCLSFQARFSAMDSMSEGAGVLIGAKRLSQQLRIGAFLDYSLARRDPQGLAFGDQQPLIGAFVGYDQEGEGRGAQGKLTAAINKGAVTITRANGLPDTEPGSGKARLNSSGLAGEIGWGFALDDVTIVTPYLGLRHTLARRGAYGESAVAGVVDFPLSYAPFSQSLTTATTGLRLTGRLTDQIGFQLGLGAEYDLARKASAYAGASAIPGLETFALPGVETSNRFRPLGNVGLFYQIDGTQRLTGSVTLRGQAFSSQMAVNVMGGYQAAF